MGIRWKLLLAASVLGNVFQFLWALDEDRVVRVPAAEFEELCVELGKRYRGSAAWLQSLAPDENHGVVMACDLVSFRGVVKSWLLGGNHVQSVVYIASR